MDESLAPLGWLVFAVGIGVILISVIPRKSQVRSPTRRLGGILSGLVFCFLASIVMLPDPGPLTIKVLVALAVICGGASWYLGRHARRMDRLARRKDR